MDKVSKADNSNICVYMAVNNKNYKDIEGVCSLVKDNPNLKSISFNLHTPYEGTEDLTLSEIAEIKNVSRNAVFDQIKKVLAILEEYERLKTNENATIIKYLCRLRTQFLRNYKNIEY
mgnify:CR=1 FL=1